MSQPQEIAKREQEKDDNPDVLFTGVAIEHSKGKTVEDYRDSIIEAAVVAMAGGYTNDGLLEAVDAYHTYLRQTARKR